MRLPVVGKAHEADASDAFTWFIYGSSLDPEAFAAWAAEHGYRMPNLGRAVPARLDGYRLAFDVESRFWGGAVASLTEARGASVEGLALSLPGEARGLVEHKEGAFSGLFEPFDVTVTPLAGGAPISALAFRASPARRLPTEVAPARAYLEVVIKGARGVGLSADWLATLERLARGE